MYFISYYSGKHNLPITFHIPIHFNDNILHTSVCRTLQSYFGGWINLIFHRKKRS